MGRRAASFRRSGIPKTQLQAALSQAWEWGQAGEQTSDLERDPALSPLPAKPACRRRRGLGGLLLPSLAPSLVRALSRTVHTARDGRCAGQSFLPHLLLIVLASWGQGSEPQTKPGLRTC